MLEISLRKTTIIITFDFVVSILKEEVACICQEITRSTSLSLLMALCSWMRPLAGSHSALRWRGVDTVAMLDLIADTLTSEETARELICLLSATHGVHSELLLVAIRDHASVNNLAM